MGIMGEMGIMCLGSPSEGENVERAGMQKLDWPNGADMESAPTGGGRKGKGWTVKGKRRKSSAGINQLLIRSIA